MALTRTPLSFLNGSVSADELPQSGAPLVAIRKLLRNVPDIFDYSATGSEADWAPVIAAGITDVMADGIGKLYIPAGTFTLATPLTVSRPVDLFGAALSTSVLVATHAGTAVNITGQHGTGGKLSNLSIGFNVPSGTPTAQIQMNSYQNPADATDHYSPDFFELANLNLTRYGGNLPTYNLILDGNMRDDDNGGSVQLGLRAVRVNRVEMFDASFRGFEARHCRVLSAELVRVYGGGGVGGLYIGGSGSGTKSASVDLSNCIVNGTLTVEQCDVGSFLGGSIGAFSGLATATDWTVKTSTGGSVTNALTNSNVTIL
jgi:hypothetical protein